MRYGLHAAFGAAVLLVTASLGTHPACSPEPEGRTNEARQPILGFPWKDLQFA